MFKQFTRIDTLFSRRKLSLFGSCLILIFAFSFIEVLPDGANSQSDPSTIRIPFELTQGRIYVEAFVNERGPFRFLVDTGASGIGRADTSLVKDLGLTTTGSTVNFDGVNSSRVETVAIASLRVGRHTRRNVEVTSRDYNAGRSPETKILQGIIGDEFFSGYLLELDYKKKEVILSKGSLNAADSQVVRYDPDEPFVVPFRIGQLEAVGLIDTGSALEMHLPLEWAKRLYIHNLKDAGEGRRANTVFKLFSAELPAPVNIAGNEIAGTEAHFSELARRINIGGLFLAKNQCVVIVDQKNHLIKMDCSRK